MMARGIVDTLSDFDDATDISLPRDQRNAAGARATVGLLLGAAANGASAMAARSLSGRPSTSAPWRRGGAPSPVPRRPPRANPFSCARRGAMTSPQGEEGLPTSWLEVREQLCLSVRVECGPVSTEPASRVDRRRARPRRDKSTSSTRHMGPSKCERWKGALTIPAEWSRAVPGPTIRSELPANDIQMVHHGLCAVPAHTWSRRRDQRHRQV